MEWNARAHSALATDEYLFHQLIPYIGNKRKLLGLILEAVQASGARAESDVFVDLFAGTGVVSRMAKQQGFAVWSNDWEPYSEVLTRCAVALDEAPTFFGKHSYDETLARLNVLPPREDWVTTHLCPRDDDRIDHARERLFYTRANGLRLDAMRCAIAAWDEKGDLDAGQKAALLAPLLYQASYCANTSGVFKGFHNGWGGATQTALYRIRSDLRLRPALFHRGAKTCQTFRDDALTLATAIPNGAFVYLDPPYNQHPYGANYHVLNSLTLWDKPDLSPQITGRGDKAAIRTDWRTQRRSAYNYATEAASAFDGLMGKLAARAGWIATSYSTDGMIPLRRLIAAHYGAGDTLLFTRPYKRYRVSSQRFSERPATIEFILLTRCGAPPRLSVDALAHALLQQEAAMKDSPSR